MTSAYAAKLDGIATSANNYIHPNHSGDVTSAGDGATTIANNAVTFAKIQTISSDTLIGRHGGGTGNPQSVSVGNGIEFSGSGIRRAALTGDVTATAGSNTTAISNGVVTEEKCNSSINASLNLADSSIQPGNAALTDERVPTAAGLSSKFGTSKATIAAGDKFAIFDSAATDAPKHSLFSLVKSTLKTYFDTLYAAIAHSHEGTAILSTGETGGTKFLREDGDGTCSWQTIAGGGDALVGNPLSQFAATTSSQLAGVISDETGSGALVFATSPTLVTPALGTPSSGTLTNCTGLPEAGLVDDAVTLAKMASGTAGNLITYDASGNPAAVATGTATHVLTSNGAGAAPTFQAAAGGGLTNFTETLLTAAPNATVNAARIAVTGGTTNTDLVLSAKGTGAIILGKAPDNTSVGGNKRGANAIDIQGFRDAAGQVASGANSIAIGNKCTATNGLLAIGDGASAAGQGSISIGNTGVSGTYAIAIGIGVGIPSGWQSSIVGGNSNTASGTNSGIFAGYISTASADSGQASGRYGLADRYNIYAHGGDGFTTLGSAQAIRAVMSVKTTNDTETELWLNGSSIRLTIPSGKILSAIVNVVGSKSDGTAVARYTRQVTIKNRAGTTELVGSVETIGVDVAAATALAITANDTNDAIKIAVTGIASETWRWVAVVNAVELIYGA
jgi:hypothetical protein